jgi:hypothetical protein
MPPSPRAIKPRARRNFGHSVARSAVAEQSRAAEFVETGDPIAAAPVLTADRGRNRRSNRADNAPIGHRFDMPMQ